MTPSERQATKAEAPQLDDDIEQRAHLLRNDVIKPNPEGFHYDITAQTQARKRKKFKKAKKNVNQ